MSNVIDLVGQKFGLLTVVERDFDRKGGYWLCKCDCGNPQLISVRGSNLKSGNSKSCGCLSRAKSKAKVEDLTGRVFNHLTVIERDLSKKGTYWLCQCDCGNPILTSVRACNLKNGNTKSCGCLRGKNLKERLIDLTGQKFGKLTVLEQSFTKNGLIYWKCQCDCGSAPVDVAGTYLKNGGTSSCGCIKSKAEVLIKNLFTQMQIDFISEKTFKDLKGKSGVPLRFDFYLPKYNLCIEYQGEQHYNRHFEGEQGLIKQQYRDELKRQYCKENLIKLIEIPYWDFNKINEEYLLKIIVG